jgi:hypothetical protein
LFKLKASSDAHPLHPPTHPFIGNDAQLKSNGYFIFYWQV